LRRGALGDESDSARVVYIVAAIEFARPLRGRLQQIAQARYRAIVQIGRTQPDSVEVRHVVTRRVFFDQTAAFDAHLLDHLIGLHRVFLAPRAEAVSTGADFAHR